MADVYADIETSPWEEVMALHERRLRDQIDYLAAESDYYRERFGEWDVDPGDVRTLEDLAAVPFTTKDDERRSQATAAGERPFGAHQAVPTADVNLTLSSSGTTGKPTYFAFTERDREVLVEMVARASYAFGVRPDDTILHAIGRPIVPGGLPYVEAYGEIGANVVPAGGADTEGLIEILADLEPDLVHSTPSHLRYLVERTPELSDHEVADFGVETLVGGGEPGIADPAFRATLREAWDAENVREVMGLGDVAPAAAAECAAEDGAHFVGQGHLHVELVDPATGEREPMETGAEGELVYTPLTREATPLLRFRSGDHARVVATECECGRTSPRLRVIGRTDDMLIYKAQNVYPTAIREVAGGVEGAENRIEVVLPDADTYHFDRPIPVRVVRDGAADRPDEAVAADVEAAVRDRLRVRVDVTLVDDDAIQQSQYKADLLTEE